MHFRSRGDRVHLDHDDRAPIVEEVAVEAGQEVCPPPLNLCQVGLVVCSQGNGLPTSHLHPTIQPSRAMSEAACLNGMGFGPSVCSANGSECFAKRS